MHISRKKGQSKCSEIVQDYMRMSQKERYLGDLITSDAKLDENVEDRYKKKA